MPRAWVATATLLVVACVGRGRELAPIRLHSILTLGDESGDGAMATDPQVSAHDRGGYRIVIPAAGGVTAAPLVYDDAGKYLGSLRGGPSPAEQFQAPLFARIGPADSIWVFDGSQRVLIFGPDRGYVRVAPLPASPWDALILPDSKIVLAPANADRPLPLLLLAPNGGRIRDFGAGDSARSELASPRWLARDSDGSIWSMPMQFQWRLEHWDSGGRLLSARERRPEWYQPYVELSAPSRDRPPPPTIQGLWIDDAGRVWVLGMAADPTWSRGLSFRPPGPGVATIGDPDKVYDTVLEMIDPATGHLVEAARFDRSYRSKVESGVIMRIVQTPRGWRRAELARATADN